jgi:hypothetical protein
MRIDTSESSTSKAVPDTDLDDMIQEHIIMSFGLTVDLVKSGYDPDFATTVVSKNILLAKRVMTLQNIFVKQLSSYVRKIVKNDPRIYTAIKNIIKNNISNIKSRLKGTISVSDDKLVDFITDNYINEINITLPKPQVTDNSNMKDLYDDYVDSVDSYLDIVISEDAVPEEYLGDLSGKLDDIKTILKTILVKKWVSDNGYMSEISKFLTKDDDGKPVFNLLEEFEDYSQTITEIILPFLKSNFKFKTKVNKNLEDIENSNTEPPEPSDDNNPGPDNDNPGTDEDDNPGIDDDLE